MRSAWKVKVEDVGERARRKGEMRVWEERGGQRRRGEGNIKQTQQQKLMPANDS